MIYIFTTCNKDMFEYVYGGLKEPIKIVPLPPSKNSNNTIRKIAHILWRLGIFIKWDFFGKEFNQFVSEIKESDKVIFYAFYPEPILNIVPRLKKGVMVSIWLWDIYTFIRQYIPILKKLHVPINTFDPQNAKNGEIGFVPQFYNFNNPKKLDITNANIPICDCYFLGHTKDSYRRQLLTTIKKTFEELGLSLFTYTVGEDEHHFMSYLQNLDNLSKCKAILELNQENQVGLTLRTMEALCYKKKLITNNCHIKEYDFYHKDNIFILGEDNVDLLANFINMPYVDINCNYKEKYDVNNWFDKIMLG